jgi:Ricin-type beta-trefoil lectin domain
VYTLDNGDKITSTPAAGNVSSIGAFTFTSSSLSSLRGGAAEPEGTVDTYSIIKIAYELHAYIENLLAGGFSSIGNGCNNFDFSGFTTLTFQGAQGLCLDSLGGGVGAPIKLFNCNGGNFQRFSSAGSGMIKHIASGLCLDAFTDKAVEGTVLRLNVCNSGLAGQRRFIYNPTERSSFRHFNLDGTKVCIDIPGSNSVPGQNLNFWTCNYGLNQLFSYGI